MTPNNFGESKLIKETEYYNVLQLGHSSYAIEVLSKGQDMFNCNSGFIIAEDGIVLIDTHASYRAEEMILSEVREISDKPIVYAINTHSHYDHILGNGALPKNTSIICHEKSEKSIHRLFKIAPYNQEITRIPDQVIKDDTILFSDGDEIHLLAFDKAHSLGEINVYYPKDNVAFTGDTYVRDSIGVMAFAYLNEWQGALQRLIDLNAIYYMPGHGTYSEADDVKRFKKYMNEFMITSADHFDNTDSVEGYVFPKEYNDLNPNDDFLKMNLDRAYILWIQDELIIKE